MEARAVRELRSSLIFRVSLSLEELLEKQLGNDRAAFPAEPLLLQGRMLFAQSQGTTVHPCACSTC